MRVIEQNKSKSLADFHLVNARLFTSSQNVVYVENVVRMLLNSKDVSLILICARVLIFYLFS